MFNIEDYRRFISPDTAALMCADLIEAHINTQDREPLREMYSYWAILVDDIGHEEAMVLIRTKMEETSKDGACFEELARWTGLDV